MRGNALCGEMPYDAWRSSRVVPYLGICAGLPLSLTAGGSNRHVVRPWETDLVPLDDVKRKLHSPRPGFGPRWGLIAHAGNCHARRT